MGTTRYTVIDGEILSEDRNGVKRDYVPDPQGNTLALLDNTQTQTDTFSYYPYGEVASRTGTTPTPFQYGGTVGYYQDNSGRTYIRARHLRTAHGRWMTQDPVGFDGGDFNLYRYVGNRPVYFADPSGLQFPLRGWDPFVPGIYPYPYITPKPRPQGGCREAGLIKKAVENVCNIIKDDKRLQECGLSQDEVRCLKKWCCNDFTIYCGESSCKDNPLGGARTTPEGDKIIFCPGNIHNYYGRGLAGRFPYAISPAWIYTHILAHEALHVCGKKDHRPGLDPDITPHLNPTDVAANCLVRNGSFYTPIPAYINDGESV